jgi:hypothetical protein
MTSRVLADHTLLLAIPAFIPAVVVVGVVIFVAMRDRRRPDDGDPEAGAQIEQSGSADDDGSP